MKVKDLIKQLQDAPPDAEVTMEGYYCGSIAQVAVFEQPDGSSELSLLDEHADFAQAR